MISVEKVWTGSNSDGSRYVGRAFGDKPTIGYGLLNDGGAGGPIGGGFDDHTNTDKGFYALSGVFRVGAARRESTAIALSASPASVAEDGGATTVTVTATLNLGTRTTATEVTVSQTGGTATSGTDYAAVDAFTVTIPAEQASGTETFTFTPTDDDADESDETVILSGSATGLTGDTATLTITDPYAHRPRFANSMETRSVAENTASGENVGAPVTATDPDNDPLSYLLEGTDAPSFPLGSNGQIFTGSALDHETKDSYSVTVKAEDGTGLSATVPVTITVTDVAEPPERPAAPTVVAIATDSLQVSWTAPHNTGPAITDYSVQYKADGSESWRGWDHVGTGLSTTITDLDAGTAYSVQVQATNAEGTGSWSPSATSRPFALPTQVASDWSLAPSGLAAGDAFRLLFYSSGTRDATSTDIADYNKFVQDTAADGHDDIQAYSAGFRAVASTAAADARDNTGTTYTADLKGPPIYWLGGAKLADDYEDFYDGKWDEEETVRDEAGDSVSFSTYDFNNKAWTGSGSDGTEAMSGDRSRALGTDAPEHGLLNFPFSTAFGPLFGDTDPKASLNPLYGLSEVFQIASEAPMISTPTLSVADGSAAEGAGTMAFAVTLSAASGQEVTVDYATTGGTATEGTDYTAASGTLTFAVGETTQTVSVSVADDALDESDEQFELRLSDAVNATLSRGTATGTIADNDDAPSLSVADRSAAEGAGPMVFTVTLSAASGQEVTVDYATAGVTATEGTDYTAASGTLTFAEGETTQTVSVMVADDSADESEEQYELRLSAAVNATLSRGTATGTITDDDSTPVIATAALIPVAENETKVATLTATDADDRVEDLTWVITSGADQDKFMLTADGELTFTAAKDYEEPDDNDEDRDYEITVQVSDGLNAMEVEFTVRLLDVDDTAPTVSRLEISSNPGSDGTYAAEEEIQVTVTFSETVEVTGTPQSSLELGGGRRTAAYQGGSGTAALVFAYEVADGESDTDGVGVAADSLSGGTITDEALNPAVLDHDALAADADHKVDGIKPTLAASGGAVLIGTTLTLTYTEPLDRSSTPDAGDFTVSGGDQARTISRVSVSGSTVVLTLDVGGEHLEAGIRVSYTPGTNKIRDVPGNEAEALSRQSVTNETPDTTAPTVESLEISSNPGFDQTYAAEDEIEVTARFSETVEVTGTPQLRLRVGSRTRTAGYVSGTGSAALVFSYEVDEGDEDSDGISIEAGRIASNGGKIEDGAENAAELAHESVAVQAGHKVDGVRPAFVSAAVDGASLTLNYGEALDAGSRPASGDFTVTVDGSGRTVSGVSINGSVVTLTLNPAAEHGDTGIRVSYTPGTNPIQDAVGNDAVALSNRPVTNTTDEPNVAPEITSPNSINVPENRAPVRRLTGRDTDAGDELTGWALVGGADQGQFSITSDTGDLSFRDAPDFEAPTDAAGSDPASEAEDNEYVVRVQVRSGAGARELTAEQTLTVTVTDEREPPGIPELPVISGETVDSLTVSWSEPDNTGPAITDYDVQYRENGVGSFRDGGHDGSGLSTTLSSLKPGTDYEVQVRARSEEGTSGWSPSGEGTTIALLTLEMEAMEEPPVSGAFAVRLSFSEEVTGFSAGDVDSSQDPACVDEQNNTVLCDPQISGLQTGDNRVFTARVTPWTDRVAHSYRLSLRVLADTVTAAASGQGNEEGILRVRVSPPGAPEPISTISLRASPGNGSVRLSWNLPSDNGGAAIIRYEYRHAPTGEGWSEWEKVGPGSGGVTVGNLINGNEYSFEVRAVNALGKGGVETAMATPVAGGGSGGGGGGGFGGGGGGFGGGGGGLLFPPEAPASLAAMPGDGAVSLAWSPPENDGGTPILRYEYRLKEGRGEFGEWTPIEDSAPGEVNATGFTVMELGNGTVYTLELRAVNLVDEGPVSAAVEVRMPLDPTYWSNFGAEDLVGVQLRLEAFVSGGNGDRELRFGKDLRFEEDELDGQGEVTATSTGSYGYGYTSRTTGELSLDHDGGEACQVRLTFSGEGEGSYVYRCGGRLVGQGSFGMSEMVNRVPELTSGGPFEVEENTTLVGQLEAVDPDEEDEVTGYEVAGGADGKLFTVETETGELSFKEGPDYENPGDMESTDPQSGAADNEYILVVEVTSGEGERERTSEQAIRVRVTDVEMEQAGEGEMGDDPSDFTAGDLEGERLTLRLASEEGTARSLELRFEQGNRFEQIESIQPAAATRSASAASRSESTTSRSGTYAYEKTAPGLGRLRLDYDDGASCEIRLNFTESGVGAFAYDCGDGNPTEGSFRLTTGSLFVPVILSSVGRNNSFFTSELTLTNRGEQDVKLDYGYTAHRGGGSGTASDVLPAGRQKIKTNAFTYLIGLGAPIPETGNRIGTLRVEAPLGSEVEAVVRTTTVVLDGRAGLAYLGVTEKEGFEEPVYLCGLRQNNQDRSNLAFQNMGAPEEGAITLRATVYSGEAGDTTARVREDVRLEPGGFYQYSPVLGVLESRDGNRQGYVKVERVEGEAPFYAYGVINDQANSDGSFVFPVTASSLEGTRGQTLPVIVETSEFRSELTVTNFSEALRTLDFQFVSDQISRDDKTASFSMTLEAGQQEIIAEVVETLRRQGVVGLGATRGFYTGPLFVEAVGGDMSGIVIGARTGSQGGGGSYSVFYNAVPYGEGFTEEAWVEGLQQNEENRSNLALVNTGEVDGSASVFHLGIYDGETGMLVETVVTRPIPARRWHQINGILGNYAPETRQGYIRIEKVSGNNPFLAYGVVNDGGAPGQRSGDGAYVPARE